MQLVFISTFRFADAQRVGAWRGGGFLALKFIKVRNVSVGTIVH